MRVGPAERMAALHLRQRRGLLTHPRRLAPDHQSSASTGMALVGRRYGMVEQRPSSVPGSAQVQGGRRRRL
ncbi:MAG: hypothetical protein JWO57_900 [Pseudonocardiales bacterium]|nr:hypothetical protein [Pseudonocardiales bacterium]